MKKKISGCIKKFFKKLFSHILLSGEDFNSVVFQLHSGQDFYPVVLQVLPVHSHLELVTGEPVQFVNCHIFLWTL